MVARRGANLPDKRSAEESANRDGVASGSATIRHKYKNLINYYIFKPISILFSVFKLFITSWVF